MLNLLPVSIIIPTQNEERFIESLLINLLSLPAVEIIVSDGGSTDNTVTICRRFRVKIVESKPGRGPQLNAGADIAANQVLWFLHADSQVQPQTLNDIRSAISKGYKWGCCSLRFYETSFVLDLIATFSNLRARCLSICYGDQGIYCHRDLFFSAGKFPDTVFLEDLAFSRTLRQTNRAHVIAGRIGSSPRRFTEGGSIRTIVKMQAVKIAYRLGFKPELLNKWYQK